MSPKQQKDSIWLVNRKDFKKTANVFAQKAFQRMIDEDLLPIPELYELWYVYYEQSNADITRAIDVMASKNEELTQEKCFDLHQRFLTERSQQKRIETAGNQIQKTIKDLAVMVADVKQSTTDYNIALSNVTQRLSGETDVDQINALIHQAIENTNKMSAQNLELEKRLEESMLKMLEMEHDLEAIKKEAFTDSLTNVSNRKAFDTELKRLAEAVNSGEMEPFSMIFIDIDKFKDFNDMFGHQVGDQVLKLVAKALVDGVKGRDTATRYGGEEFAILLPETPIQGSMRVANSLCKAIADKEVINRLTGEPLARITISGGVAEFVPGETIHDFIHRADRALYKAKKNGRNQMIEADLPLDEAESA